MSERRIEETITRTHEAEDLRAKETMALAAEDLRAKETMAPAVEDLRAQETMAPAVEDLRAQETIPPDSTSAAAGESAWNDSVETVDATDAGPAARPADHRVAVDRHKSRANRRDHALRPGMTVAKYELIRELGHGGMGAVYLARDTRLGRRVALKFLRVNNPKMAAQFIKEARTTARCSHENIVVLHEADEFRGTPYMVLEYLQGKTLAEILEEARAADERESGRLLSVARAVELIVSVLRALERAHSMGIVHRDLKPANVMLTDSGTVKVLDFGIAKVLAGDTSEFGKSGEFVKSAKHSAARAEAAPDAPAQPEGLAGTLPYMSPEQLRGEPVDGRTDIWAIGVMLHEMVTGEHPLGAINLKKLEWLSESAEPMPRVSENRPELGAVGAIIDRCLIKHAGDRIESASALLGELGPLMPDSRGASLSEGQSPFAGLSAFQEADADRFFGRAGDIANLVTRVRNQPLVAVVGPSGVGKSSLVRAGVIPALKRSGEGWDSVIVRPGRAPLAALARILEFTDRRSTTDQTRPGIRLATGPITNPGTNPSTNPGTNPGTGRTSRPNIQAALDDPKALDAELRREPGLLGAELRAWAQRKLRRLLIFIDQFEEIYTATGDADERAAFLACVDAMADDPTSPLRVVLTVRADFLERMAKDRTFMASVTRSLMFLAPMGRPGLRQALENPLEAAGYRFESPAMVDEMLDEIESAPGALPLLQFTASHLWEARDRKEQLLTEASYRDLGGIAGTLARHADDVLAGMSAQQVKLARAIFERLVTPERTRTIVSLSELCALPWPAREFDDVLGALASARLVVVESAGTEQSGVMDRDGQRGKVEIVHESLIATWPTLGRWLDESKDDAKFLARLRSATRAWEKSGHAAGTLWRDEVAEQAQRWRAHYTEPLPEREERYLKAVFELADRAARRKRNLIIAVMAIWALLVLAAAFVYVEFRSKDRTIDEQVAEIQDKNQALDRQLGETRRALDQAKEAKHKANVERDRAEEALADASRLRVLAETSADEAREARALAESKATDEAAARLRAEQARLAAEKAREAAEKARLAAEKAEATAKQARDAEKSARLRLQELLDREKARIKRLEQKLQGKMIPEAGNP